MAHHGTADRLAIRRSVEFGDNLAGGHHADSIGQAEHLIEILADKNDSHAIVTSREQTPMNRGARAYVQPSARAMHDDDRRFATELPLHHQLLRVSTGQQTDPLEDTSNSLYVCSAYRDSRHLAHRGAVYEIPGSQASVMHVGDG